MNAAGLWAAVAERNAEADGLFVYAVSSTRIYCRPSCPSRRPRRNRVEFFPSGEMARSAGYRACRRCHPDQLRSGTPAMDRVKRVCAAVAARPALSWTSARLSKVSGASAVQLQRAFRQVLGMSPRDYVAACRRRRFLEALRKESSVTNAIYEAGYGSPSRVYGAIDLPGMTPATYGRGGEGAHIRWATIGSSIGRLLVAATNRGLCFVEVGETEAGLMATLRHEFPRATIDSRASDALATYLEAARGVAEASEVPQHVPVDIRGTAFQWKVWRALTRIPRGKTLSYTEVAATIGRPAAVRAVARACATNPLSLVVPCHRVVGRDGAVTGYRWGVDVKRQLLDREQS